MRLGFEDRYLRRTLAALTLGAIALRLLMFVGRGDYIAFDEGWYLLLAKSLWSGEGYRLTGLRHVTLSPLFPILAGGLDRILDDPVWAGRVVAAVTAGLLVLPCWSIFRRLAGRRTALLGCAIVAVIPSLAPFVAPEWVGWDLWVGAEPVYHLFLFSGVALALRAWDRDTALDWACAGIALSLAYLSRSEGVVMAGLLGLSCIGMALLRRRTKVLAGAVVMGVAFVACAVPYWVYLHDATGLWSLTGRAIQVTATTGTGQGQARASEVIERMLWEGRHGAYVRMLFALHPSGTRMASSYWGVPGSSASAALPHEDAVAGRLEPPAMEPAVVSPNRSSRDAVAAGWASLPQPMPPAESAVAGGGPERANGLATGAADPTGQAGLTPAVTAMIADTVATAETDAAPQMAFGRAGLYVKTARKLVPVLLWPFILIGLVPARRRPRDAEWLFITPFLAASVAIGLIVAIDPRTQLFLVPAAAFILARGARRAAILIERRFNGTMLRRGFTHALLVFVILASLAGEDIRRLYLSLSVESSQAYWAAEHRRAGEAVGTVVPAGETVMSWHPAVAIYARRPWRVLPLASVPEILDYARAIDCRNVVFSMYNPNPIPFEQMPRPYLLVRIEPGDRVAGPNRIEVTQMGAKVAVGRFVGS